MNNTVVHLRKTVGLWAFEPGPLKVVGIDAGSDFVRVNPEEGGVVVAVVKPDIVVQDGENLRIYQSTKQFEVVGSGFEGCDVSVYCNVIGQEYEVGTSFSPNPYRGCIINCVREA